MTLPFPRQCQPWSVADERPSPLKNEAVKLLSQEESCVHVASLSPFRLCLSLSSRRGCTRSAFYECQRPTGWENVIKKKRENTFIF